MSFDEINTLVLSSGGAKTIAFIGAIKGLEDINLLKNIKKFVGVSGGSLISLLLILGYTSDEMYNKILETNISHLQKKEYFKIFNYFGIDSGNKFVGWIQRLIIEKLGPNTELITLKELYDKTGKELIITVSNLCRYRVEYLDHINHPNLSISTAIRMSISIPLLFTAVKYDEDIYVDGALLDSFPIIQYPKDTTIGIYLEGDNPQNHDGYRIAINNFEEYFMHLCNCIYTHYDKLRIEKTYNESIININCNKVVATDFNISLKNKLKLFINGYIKTMEFAINKKWIDNDLLSNNLEQIMLPKMKNAFPEMNLDEFTIN